MQVNTSGGSRQQMSKGKFPITLHVSEANRNYNMNVENHDLKIKSDKNGNLKFELTAGDKMITIK